MMWKQYDIPELNISFEMYEKWPLRTWRDGNIRGFYQPVEDTSGVQFIQFGSSLTIDKYIGQLGDSFNRIIIAEEGQVLYQEHTATRKRLYMFLAAEEVNDLVQFEKFQLEGKVSNELEIEAIGLTQFKEPLIIGYRIPLKHKAQYWQILNRFVYSIKRISELNKR